MAILTPDALARGTMTARLADLTTGFNVNYALAQSTYPGAPDMTIDFTASSKNCFYGQFTPDEIQGSATFTLPLVRMWAKASANKNRQKFQRFAGITRCYAAFDLSNKIFKSTRPVNDSESWGDAVTGAVLETFNAPTPSVQSAFMQQVVYNGEIAWERGPLSQTGTNWQQTILFIAEFEVIIP